jgi:hypothetical protein
MCQLTTACPETLGVASSMQADEVLKLSAPVPILCGESSAQLV